MCSYEGMRTYLPVILSAMCLVSLGACDADNESSQAEQSDDAIRSQPTPQQVEEVFRAVDDNCAGNSNGGLSRFDPAGFKAAEAMKKLRDEDKDAMGVDCRGQRSYSDSRESGVKLFLDHINDAADDTKSCLKENLTTQQRSLLKR